MDLLNSSSVASPGIPSGRRAALAIAGLTLLAGCSSAPAVGDIPTLTSTAGIHLPIEQYMPSSAQAARVTDALSTLTAQCMHQHGFTYPVTRAVAGIGVLDRRYGITDAGNGYHLPAGQLPSPPPVAAHSPAELTALTGDSQGRTRPGDPAGCLGEAQHKLDSGGATYGTSPIARQVDHDSFDASKADSRVQAVFAQWSACMKDAGYRADSPMDVPPDSMSVTTPKPSAAELAMATADVACKRRTNLVGVWFTVETAYQRQLIDQHADELDRARAGLAAELKLVDSVNGG
ncbi:hypothetical protein [Kutzneria buriramensis]|uniref:Uncharacterized protein n=1 Tax=Kutzneria buriramensis TaxID=1045776 RepID=A0A3E0H7Q5_9PSEU|nr:hypothetical protein [Kutzneria buriramensis]REH39470.1 hypothetical protein BCF44_113325 [Kutzneria buriramensis]